MLNMICSFGFIGILFSAIVIPYVIFITIMFAIYKATGGRKSYWDYMSLW